MLVGSNGSGKSTLVKLLLRLYKPSDTPTRNHESDSQNTSEQILIDEKPASSYPESYLRQSMAVLNQDNLIYPGFSLGENIGLGFSALVSDEESINIAARKAGAKEVLERMKDGANTVLDPQLDVYEFNVKQQDKSHPLKKALEELRRPVEVSGGEKQRIVA
jgi:ABC-type multidrug transport system fused ATPase/permease subunit